jgi:hypothetical protein
MYAATLLTLDELSTAAVGNPDLHDALDERLSNALAIEHLAGPNLPFIHDDCVNFADDTQTSAWTPDLT